MDDARGVGRRDGDQRLQDVVDDVDDGQLAVLLEELPEVAPFEVLEHHVRGAGVELADVHHGGDVLAPDAGGRAGLVEEARTASALSATSGSRSLSATRWRRTS